MGVAKQIKIFSNFKKQSSKDSKTKNSVINISREYERIGEQKNPDINHNLSSENLILKKFDIKEYEKIIENTDYNLNSKNSKYEDIYSTTPTIQATNFVNLGGINLTFLMEKEEWVEYYKDLSGFIKDYLGDDFNPLCEVIQFDEFTPHLQLMGIFRSEVSNETLANKNLESDSKLFEEISRKKFTRYNNKLKGTDEYIDPKNKKEYKQAKIKWVEENKSNIIKNYKPRNKKTDKKYAYVRMNNPMAMKRYSYKDYQNKLYEFNKEHKFIKKLCEKATKIRGEEVSFVKNSTEPVYDGKSKNHYEIKETIERENKEIESKIKKGIDLTENEVYRYIRKQNREKLKQEFLELDISNWENKFKEPQKAQYDFNLKLSNDYIKTAKEIAYKPYMEKIDELKSDFKAEKEKIDNFYKYEDIKIFYEMKKTLDSMEKEKNIFGKETGKYILTKEIAEQIEILIRTRIYNHNQLIEHKENLDKEYSKKEMAYKTRLNNILNDRLDETSEAINKAFKKVFGYYSDIDLKEYKTNADIEYSLSGYKLDILEKYRFREEEVTKRENKVVEFENEKDKILEENKNLKDNFEKIVKEKVDERVSDIKLENQRLSRELNNKQEVVNDLRNSINGIRVSVSPKLKTEHLEEVENLKIEYQKKLNEKDKIINDLKNKVSEYINHFNSLVKATRTVIKAFVPTKIHKEVLELTNDIKNRFFNKGEDSDYKIQKEIIENLKKNFTDSNEIENEFKTTEKDIEKEKSKFVSQSKGGIYR